MVSDYQEASGLYAAGRYEEAGVKAQAVVAVSPGHWQAWQLLGSCRYAQGSRAGAGVAFNMSLQGNPDNPQLKTFMGQAGIPVPDTKTQAGADATYREALDSYNGGNMENALLKAVSAVGINPVHWQAWQLVGTCRYGKGDRQGALEAFHLSLESNPDNPQLRSFTDGLMAPAQANAAQSVTTPIGSATPDASADSESSSGTFSAGYRRQLISEAPPPVFVWLPSEQNRGPIVSYKAADKWFYPYRLYCTRTLPLLTSISEVPYESDPFYDRVDVDLEVGFLRGLLYVDLGYKMVDYKVAVDYSGSIVDGEYICGNALVSSKVSILDIGIGIFGPNDFMYATEHRHTDGTRDVTGMARMNWGVGEDGYFALSLCVPVSVGLSIMSFGKFGYDGHVAIYGPDSYVPTVPSAIMDALHDREGAHSTWHVKWTFFGFDFKPSGMDIGVSARTGLWLMGFGGYIEPSYEIDDTTGYNDTDDLRDKQYDFFLSFAWSLGITFN